MSRGLTFPVSDITFCLYTKSYKLHEQLLSNISTKCRISTNSLLKKQTPQTGFLKASDYCYLMTDRCPSNFMSFLPDIIQEIFLGKLHFSAAKTRHQNHKTKTRAKAEATVMKPNHSQLLRKRKDCKGFVASGSKNVVSSFESFSFIGIPGIIVTEEAIGLLHVYIRLLRAYLIRMTQHPQLAERLYNIIYRGNLLNHQHVIQAQVLALFCF